MLRAQRPGFTLVELIFAAFIFAVGVLALEATAAGSLRRMQRSAQLTLAASVARSRLESLAGSRCGALHSGADTVRSVVSQWVVEAAAPSLRLVTQTVTYRLDGSERQDSYRALVPCSQ